MENSGQDKITVMIIDDHRLFNDGLNAMLGSDPDIHILAQVYNSRDARVKVNKLNPDVVLMDFNMPHINGIELTKLMLSEHPAMKILILSMYDDERHIDTFKEIGAKGYVFKTASVEEVIRAIRKVGAGEYYFPKVDSKGYHADDAFIKQLKLSRREMEVIQLIKTGMTTKQIAQKLEISYYTAETHRKNIKLKVGVKGEADFIKFIFEM